MANHKGKKGYIFDDLLMKMIKSEIKKNNLYKFRDYRNYSSSKRYLPGPRSILSSFSCTWIEFLTDELGFEGIRNTRKDAGIKSKKELINTYKKFLKEKKDHSLLSFLKYAKTHYRMICEFAGSYEELKKSIT